MEELLKLLKKYGYKDKGLNRYGFHLYSKTIHGGTKKFCIFKEIAGVLLIRNQYGVIVSYDDLEDIENTMLKEK